MTYNALCIEDDALFRKNVLSIQKHNFKSKRINKVDNMRQNKSGKNNSVRYPELPTYNFAGTPKEIVNSLRNVEANIRWPKKYDQPGKAKNRTTWCDFHDDHGHTTEDCISLRMKVVYHKPKGYLQNVLPGEPTSNDRLPSPIHTKVLLRSWASTEQKSIAKLESSTAVSAAMVREEDKQQRPIYYVSKSLLDAKTRYASMEKLLLGLITVAKKLRHYFESHHTIVVTNYPLKTVLRKPELTGHLAKWNIYLSGFDIEFKPKTAIKSQVLADFVAEFSPRMEPTTCDEIVMISDNKPWILYVDGSSNVRGSGLGVVLKSSQGGNMAYSIRYDAKYEALIAGLDIAYKLGARHLNARSDSLLIVNQVNGDFQAKDSKMMSYLKIVKDRVARFDHFAIEQIPRDLNTQADALANLGSAFNEPTVESIPIIHFMTSTNKTKEEVPMNEDIYNWSLDIWNYLKHKQLLEDKKEARKTKSKASRSTLSSTSGLLLRCITSKTQMNRVHQEMHDGKCEYHSGGRSLTNWITTRLLLAHIT
ncbi:hypothetical protein OSB04_002809 [Centaurea solstitialis]|uniref:RNase H type-1 domain-containing protein n=1 Tax=Centaurea solstitialis TaxID=347529 RepID=A0AA38UBS8_9ASTR|nr:hypothetical protein OSB04_002809 [Centaurea solstitialis]